MSAVQTGLAFGSHGRSTTDGTRLRLAVFAWLNFPKLKRRLRFKQIQGAQGVLNVDIFGQWLAVRQRDTAMRLKQGRLFREEKASAAKQNRE